MSGGYVYVLHIEPAFWHARHYIGWTADPPARRLTEHLAGQGSPLIKAAIAAGAKITLVSEIPGDKTLERKLKRQGGHGNRICPLCRPAHLDARRQRRAQRGRA